MLHLKDFTEGYKFIESLAALAPVKFPEIRSQHFIQRKINTPEYYFYFQVK